MIREGFLKEVTSKMKSEELAGEKMHKHVREIILNNYYGMNCVLPNSYVEALTPNTSEGD